MHLGSGLPTYTQFPLTVECPLAALQLTDTQKREQNTTTCTVLFGLNAVGSYFSQPAQGYF